MSQGPSRGSVAEQAFGVGWWELDEIFKFYLGQFVMVTGTSGHGKSTFLLNIALRLGCLKGIKSFLYVPENEFYLYDKFEKLFPPCLKSTHAGWFDRFVEQQCFVQYATGYGYDKDPQTLMWVLERAEAAIRRDKVELVIIDPWNELERAKPRDTLLTDYIGQCLMYLKAFARSLNVVVVLVAHPTKDGVKESKKNGTPLSLADIEGSMNWFNKCDNGLVIARDFNNGTTKVCSVKVREIGAGKIGDCYFQVDPQTGIFTPQYGGTSL